MTAASGNSMLMAMLVASLLWLCGPIGLGRELGRPTHSVVDVLRRAEKLDGASLTLKGFVVSQPEFLYLTDDPKRTPSLRIRKRQWPAGISLSVADSCKTFDEAESTCGDYLVYVAKRAVPVKLLVTLKTKNREIVSPRGAPEIGFGHLGVFPAEATVQEIIRE